MDTSVTEQSRGARGILSSSGIRKATSRVTFKSSKSLKRFVQLTPFFFVSTHTNIYSDAALLGEFKALTPEELREETRERASNWTLFSFSNSHHLENHLPLSDFDIQPNELFEVRLCSHSLPFFLSSTPHCIVNTLACEY